MKLLPTSRSNTFISLFLFMYYLFLSLCLSFSLCIISFSLCLSFSLCIISFSLFVFLSLSLSFSFYSISLHIRLAFQVTCFFGLCLSNVIGNFLLVALFMFLYHVFVLVTLHCFFLTLTLSCSHFL